MTVRAKFFVQKVSRHAHAPLQAEVVFAVATRGDENKSWAAYTPSGSITMQVSNEVAAERFELGKEYYVDFTPAE